MLDAGFLWQVHSSQQLMYDNTCMQLASGARAFLPTQFGLSFFVWEGGCYSAHTFNVFLFPQPLISGLDKRFTCQARLLPPSVTTAL